MNSDVVCVYVCVGIRSVCTMCAVQLLICHERTVNGI